MNEPGKLILVIEDDSSIRSMIRDLLAPEGHRLLEADGAQVGMHLFRSRKPDLVLLDVELPDGNGREVCRKMRASESLGATPVIMLTGQAKLADKLSGFDVGVDQYLTKPIHPKELLMWVRALLRRVDYDNEEGDELRSGELSIDLKAHLVRFREQTIGRLTGKEFDLLYYLVKKSPHVLSRKYILSNLWHTIAVDHVVDTHISNLRKKLPPEVSDRVQNVPGKGFRYLA